MRTLGRMWLSGADVAWAAFQDWEERRRIALPGYPFERDRYLIEPDGPKEQAAVPADPLRKKADISEWFYVPSWKRSIPEEPERAKPETVRRNWLVFLDDCGLGAQ